MARKKTRGFTKNANKIARREGVSKKGARAILAKSTRGASPSAKRKNPNLKRVKMPKKKR